MELVRRFLIEPEQSFFLFGPRGTGKTNWTKHVYSDGLGIDLLDPEMYRALQTWPERLIEIVEGSLEKKVVIIDEVQKVPELLDVVHLLIERYPEKIFVLTGSSARKLKRKEVNLLGGRALNLSMHPYMAAELGEQFRLEKALVYGMVPLVWASKVPEKVLQAYISVYLQEEVQQEGLVRNVGGFARFLEAMSFSQGSPLNVNNIARESQVGRKAVESYVSILEDLLLGFRLNVFSKRAKRELAVHPKFYYFDCGVYRSIRPRGPMDKVSEIDGIALESLVAQHLMSWCDYSEGGHKLYYWQTRSQVEVDFVIYGETGVYAFEVKNASRCDRSDLGALKAFGEDYPEAKRCLLYRGKERLKIDDVMCIPCEEFLMSLIPGKVPIV
jgi:predicted AAA+ superfamily ATPase